MAGPGGQEAGRISIRVLPNTENFARSLQRYLDRIEERSRVQVKATLDMTGFATDLRTTLRDLNARVKVRVDPDLSNFATDLRAQLSTGGARVPVRISLADGEITRLRAQLASITPPIVIPVRIDGDNPDLSGLTNQLSSVGDSSGSAAGGIGKLVGSLGRLSVMASSIPSIASLASTLTQLGPAAALAAPALLTVATAGAAVKIGMTGVSEAISGGSKELKKLTPNAQEFVKELKALAPAWKDLQKSVQEKLFVKMGSTLKSTAKEVLPELKKQLGESAESLNLMGRQVLNTATGLSKSGALGTALDGANEGLRNMSGLPAVIVQGLVQLGAAAAPAFGKITAAIGRSIENLSVSLTNGLENGDLQASIDRAVSLASHLWEVAKDLGATLANIFGPAAAAGAGFINVLAVVAQTLRDVTGSAEAQETLKALFETLASLGTAVGQILGAALKAVMPLINTLVTTLAGPLQSAFETLAPVLSTLIAQIGEALAPIVKAMAEHWAKLIPIVVQIVSMLGTALGPILVVIGELFGQLIEVLSAALMPVLEQLPTILQPILDAFTTLVPILGDVIAQLIEALAPALQSIGELLAVLMVALEPLITALGELLVKALEAAMPAIEALMPLITKLTDIMADLMASAIMNVVIPAIEVLVALLSGDFKGAIEATEDLLNGIGRYFKDVFESMTKIVKKASDLIIGSLAWMASKAWEWMGQMGTWLWEKATSGMSDVSEAIKSGVSDAVDWLAELPGKSVKALGDLSMKLYSAGSKLIGGFVDGIKGAIGGVKDTLTGLTGDLTSWKGPETLDARILTPAGELVIDGFITGLRKRVPDLKSMLGGLTMDIPEMLGTASVVGSFSADTPAGLQPGDRIVLSPDGQREFSAYIDRLADARMVQRLGAPATRGRR
ncbi:hypothetical protein LHJ74_30710 [Streptomyces sp. N2-109]|uniref:Tape measure protein n=1 Tax=Streptomyces gossypii TaxID=2883101 RepID=A0ABT2K2V6_9ACTN|nr:hypothetical protein [Streptomyces gossypii]MCT2594228.1 hypothetical protein [Streptomyces gossypii]